MSQARTTAQNLKEFFLPVRGNYYSPRFLMSRTVFYVVVFLLVTKIVALIILLPSKNVFLADVTGTDLFSMLNQSRVNQGLNPLTENTVLEQAARMKAQDMVANNYFSHQSPQGLMPWFWFSEAGYQYSYAGENLAVGFIDSRTVLDEWLNSPSHRDNILNPNYTEVGTAVVNGFGNNHTIVVVQMFGTPRSAEKAGTVAQPKKQTPAPQPVTPQVAGVEVLSQQTESTPQQQPSPFVAGIQSFFLYLYGNGYLRIFSFALLILAVLAWLSHVIAHRQMANRNILFRSLIFIIMLVSYLAVNQELINYLLSQRI